MNPHSLSLALTHSLRTAALLAGLALSTLAAAHKASDAYLRFDVNGAEITSTIDVALRDIDRDLVLDQDDDGRITWGEVRQRWGDVQQWVASGVKVTRGDAVCAAVPAGQPQLDEHADGRYAALAQRWTCPGAAADSTSAAPLRIAYTLMADTDPTHRGIVRVQFNGAATDASPEVTSLGATPAALVQTAVLGPGATAQTFTGAASGGAASSTVGLWAAVVQGMHHILIGSDHIAFLLALLLPAVLVYRPTGRGGLNSAWGSSSGNANPFPASSVPASGLAVSLPVGQRLFAGLPSLPRLQMAGLRVSEAEAADWFPATQGRAVVLDVARVITAFTLAHSITLALAAFDWVVPPARWVESLIAASVVLAALNNLWPVMSGSRTDGRVWAMAFGFGLVHGFGFASVMKELDLGHGAALLVPLLGFNLGVELGQLSLVALFLPLAWAARASRFYRWGLFRGGSVAIAALATLWLIDRAFEMDWAWLP